MVRRSFLPVATAAAAALVLLSVGCSAQDSVCPMKNVVTNFNASLYKGTWYEYAKKGRTRFEEGAICVTAEYTLSANGDNITVVNSMKDNRTLEANSTKGWAEFVGDQKDAKLVVHFPNSTAVGNYWVLSTDYENYSIVWSCSIRPDNAELIEISWILVRSRRPSNQTLEKVEQELKNAQLSMDTFTKTEQNPAVCDGAGRMLGAVLSVVMASLFALLH